MDAWVFHQSFQKTLIWSASRIVTGGCAPVSRTSAWCAVPEGPVQLQKRHQQRHRRRILEISRGGGDGTGNRKDATWRSRGALRDALQRQAFDRRECAGLPKGSREASFNSLFIPKPLLQDVTTLTGFCEALLIQPIFFFYLLNFAVDPLNPVEAVTSLRLRLPVKV